MSRQGDESQFQGQGEAAAKHFMGNPQEKGWAWSLCLSCRTLGRQQGFTFHLEIWYLFQSHCFLSKDTSLGYHHSMVRNQKVTNLTPSFQKSAITPRSECKLYLSILNLSSKISFCTRQIWVDKKASNKEPHSPNPNKGTDLQGLGKFLGFGIIWDTFCAFFTNCKMHIKSEE